MKDHFRPVYTKIMEEIKENPGLVFLVIDPPNQTPETAGKIAKSASEAGVAAFAVGGSVGAQGALLDETIKHIKDNSNLPVILFPGNIATLSQQADAIYFMSMLNSIDPYYISGAQIAASAPVKRMKLETIPTSYIIVEPGRAVGWVGRARLIPRELPYLAGISALAGQYMGAHCVILESGGGASSPAPPEMVKYTKNMIDIPLIVAGGVRTDKYAYDTTKAGADIVHVGAAIEEQNSDIAKAEQKMKKIVEAAHKGAKERTK